MTISRNTPITAALLLSAGFATTCTAGEVFSGRVLLRAGDTVAGAEVTRMTTPRRTAGGTGYLLMLDDNRHAVSYAGQIVAIADNPVRCDAPTTELTHIVGDIDFADDGRYLYTYYAEFAEPFPDGGLFCYESHLYDETGLLYSDSQPAPGFAGSALTGMNNPIVQPDGKAYWGAGFVADLPGDGVGERNFNAIYQRDAGTDSVYWGPGQSIAGFPTSFAGLLRVSSDDAHRLLLLADASDQTNIDYAVAVDDQVVATKWDPVGDNLIWENFRSLDINSAGDYAIAGSTSRAGIANPLFGVLEVNGTVQLKEGDTLLGDELMDTCNGFSLNDAGAIAFTWDSGEQTNAMTNGAIYYASDADDIQGTARLMLRKDAQLDTDGDGVGDETVVGIVGVRADPGYELGDDNRLLVTAALRPVQGGPSTFAIVELSLGCNAADIGAPFGVLDLADVQGFVSGFAAQSAAADLAEPVGVWDLADVQAFVTDFNAGCP